MASRPEIVSLSAYDLTTRSYSSATLRAPNLSLHYLTHLRPYILLLPLPEQDVIALYVSQGVRQVAIALLLGVSQQTVSRRLQRANQRLLFHLHQPVVEPAQMRMDLSRLLARSRMVDVLCDLSQTASYLVSAGRLGVVHQEVQGAGQEALNILAATAGIDALFYLSYFERLLRHRNIFGVRVRTYVEPAKRAARAGSPVRPWARGGANPAQRRQVPAPAVYRGAAGCEAAGAVG